jgi:hypothetical protein
LTSALSADVKNEWSFIPVSPLRLHGMDDNNNKDILDIKFVFYPSLSLLSETFIHPYLASFA